VGNSCPTILGNFSPPLTHLEKAHGCPPRQLVGQLDDAVHHRMLGRNPFPLNAREHEHRAVGRNGKCLKLMHEFIESLLVVQHAFDGRNAVEHQG
jgi:hypothetical protein